MGDPFRGSSDIPSAPRGVSLSSLDQRPWTHQGSAATHEWPIGVMVIGQLFDSPEWLRLGSSSSWRRRLDPMLGSLDLPKGGDPAD